MLKNLEDNSVDFNKEIYIKKINEIVKYYINDMLKISDSIENTTSMFNFFQRNPNIFSNMDIIKKNYVTFIVLFGSLSLGVMLFYFLCDAANQQEFHKNKHVCSIFDQFCKP